MAMHISGTMVLIAIASVGISSASIAAIPIPTTGIIWHGDFDGQGGVLSGNCGTTQDGYCQRLTVRDAQIQFSQNPLAEGQFSARFETGYGDDFPGMSDSRALLNPSLAAYSSEGMDQWYRWQVFLPADYKSDYPKEDELGTSDATTAARRGGGYNVEWHHEFFADGFQGSAPVYMSTGGGNFTLCIDQLQGNTFTLCTSQVLMRLVTGQWVDWVVHARWSSVAGQALFEVWADTGSGLTFLYSTTQPNMYSGYRNYWTVGAYRNHYIGDPNLRYRPCDSSYPQNLYACSGPLVYPTNPLTVFWLDGFVIGNSQAAVYNAPLFGPPGGGGGGGGGGSAIFSDNFNRTTGLGSNWSIPYGGFTTDGANAVSGAMTSSGTGNWAGVVPAIGTSDYAVVANLTVPSGSLYSGVFARGSGGDFTSDLYAAQIATDGTVNLYRRNSWAWTQLASAPAGIVAGTNYTLKLVTMGNNPVHLEAWVNGTRYLSYDDNSASRVFSGVPGVQNYDGSVRYNSFEVDPVTTPLFSDDFNRTTGLGSNWSIPYGGFTTDGANAVSGAMTSTGTGNWAGVVPAIGTNDYAVVANLTIPSGSLYSGVIARGSGGDFTSDGYAAQISTDGTVNLYRRNSWGWTALASAPAGIVAGTNYPLKLVTMGNNPVHLEAWVNGTRYLSYDDSSASRVLSGVPGMENYDGSVRYNSFAVYAGTGP